MFSSSWLSDVPIDLPKAPRTKKKQWFWLPRNIFFAMKTCVCFLSIGSVGATDLPLDNDQNQAKSRLSALAIEFDLCESGVALWHRSAKICANCSDRYQRWYTSCGFAMPGQTFLIFLYGSVVFCRGFADAAPTLHFATCHGGWNLKDLELAQRFRREKIGSGSSSSIKQPK